MKAFSVMLNALMVLPDPDAKRLWICVLFQQNTDPHRLPVRGGPISMDLCFARAKHRATTLVLAERLSGGEVHRQPPHFPSMFSDFSSRAPFGPLLRSAECALTIRENLQLL